MVKVLYIIGPKNIWPGNPKAFRNFDLLIKYYHPFRYVDLLSPPLGISRPLSMTRISQSVISKTIQFVLTATSLIFEIIGLRFLGIR